MAILSLPGMSGISLRRGWGGGGGGGVERRDGAMVGGGGGLAQVGGNGQRREFKIVRTMLTVQSAPLLD